MDYTDYQVKVVTHPNKAMKYNTTILLAVLMIVTTVGCQSVPWRKNAPAEPPEMAAMRNQIQQYQARTNALEASNSQINIQLAQTKQELLSQLEGTDLAVMKLCVELPGAKTYDFASAFETLFGWCQQTLASLPVF